LHNRLTAHHADVPIHPSAAAIQAWLDMAPNAERSGNFAAIRPDRMRAFLSHLPPPPAPCTVAGTKGKGSTVRLIEAALVGNGVRTVAFASPHVLSVLERWRTDGSNADPAELAPLCDQVQATEDASGLRLSWFERSFAVACLLAQRRGAAFVCEVGLGGRLDATNALDAAVAVVTHISHDHREVLGPTVWHIAAEKLAIARPGRPLVIAPQSAAAALAIWHRQPVGAAVYWAVRPTEPFALAMDGEHQQDNAATALCAAMLYRPGLDPGLARRGMADATLAARCQLVQTGQRQVLVDGAHNGSSLAAALAVAQRRLAPGWTLILGTARDKEIDEMLAVLPPDLRVVRCGFTSPRARSRDDWPSAALAWPWYDDIGAALADASGDVCVAGSLYLAGEALQRLG
jgi:dihydrofolate synthase / folylpolyglutamate synthase